MVDYYRVRSLGAGLGEWAYVKTLPSEEEVMRAGWERVLSFGEEAVHQSLLVVPVDKGNLLLTIRVEQLGESLMLVAGGLQVRNVYVDYAAIVHDGLGRGRNAWPRPFLQWGIEAALTKLALEHGTIWGRDVVADPFTGTQSFKQLVVSQYAVPSHIGFGTTPVGRIPKGQPGAGRFFSLKRFL